MIQLVATLHVLGTQVMDYTERQAKVLRAARDDRGSVTIEQVMWAAILVALVLGVAAVIRNFVQNEAGKITNGG